jgi:hypothetical protein
MHKSPYVLLFALTAFGQTRQPLLDDAGHVKDEAYIPAPLPDSARAYADISGAKMKTLVEEIVAISLKSRDDGNRYWGRIAGTKYETMTGDLMEAKFRKLGLTDIRRPEFALPPQWVPTDWDLTATADAKTLKFSSLLPALGSAATPEGGIEMEPVWVGLGTAGDFAGRDVRGKAVIIHAMLAPGEMGQSANLEGAFARAISSGAGAVIGIWGYYDNMGVWQGFRTGSIDRQMASMGPIPAFWLGFEDGKKLRDLVAEGGVKVRMRVQAEMVAGQKSISVYGTLPGRAGADENILLMAHMDGYFEAALDNASGLSAVLALAEHFSQVPREQRRRNLIFIGTAGHHVGSPNARYLRDRKDLLDKTALMINCEHIAVSQTLNWQTTLRRSTVVWPRRWWVNGSPRLTDLTLDAYRTLGVGVIGDMDPSATGEMGAIARLTPSIQLIRSPESKHTDADIRAFVPSAGLEAVGRAYAKIIDGVNKLDRKDLLPEK